MSDEMDVLFDHRLRNALHGTSLPAAPASLRSALEDLLGPAARSWPASGTVICPQVRSPPPSL